MVFPQTKPGAEKLLPIGVISNQWGADISTHRIEGSTEHNWVICTNWHAQTVDVNWLSCRRKPQKFAQQTHEHPGLLAPEWLELPPTRIVPLIFHSKICEPSFRLTQLRATSCWTNASHLHYKHAGHKNQTIVESAWINYEYKDRKILCVNVLFT